MTAILQSLTPRQAAAVAFVATFVTVIGGLLLAIYFKRRNDRRTISWNKCLTDSRESV